MTAELAKLFAGIVDIDEARRVVTARSIPLSSPGDFEIERAALEGLAGRELYGVDWRKPAGAVVGVAFPARSAVLVHPDSGEREVDVTGTVEVTARVDDDAEWTKVLEGVYIGLSLGPRAVGLIDDPSMYAGADNKLAKLACAKAAAAASVRALTAPLLAQMAEVSKMVAALEHQGRVNGVAIELRLIGLSKSLDTG